MEFSPVDVIPIEKNVYKLFADNNPQLYVSMLIDYSQDQIEKDISFTYIDGIFFFKMGKHHLLAEMYEKPIVPILNYSNILYKIFVSPGMIIPSRDVETIVIEFFIIESNNTKIICPYILKKNIFDEKIIEKYDLQGADFLYSAEANIRDKYVPLTRFYVASTSIVDILNKVAEIYNFSIIRRVDLVKGKDFRKLYIYFDHTFMSKAIYCSIKTDFWLKTKIFDREDDGSLTQSGEDKVYIRFE